MESSDDDDIKIIYESTKAVNSNGLNDNVVNGRGPCISTSTSRTISSVVMVPTTNSNLSIRNSILLPMQLIKVPPVNGICNQNNLPMPMQVVAVNRTTGENGKSCDLIQKTLASNAGEFAKCQAFVCSKQPALVNGAGPTSVILKPINGVISANAIMPIPSGSGISTSEIQFLNVLPGKPERLCKLPSAGPLVRLDVHIGDIVYAMKIDLFDVWVLAKITKEIVDEGVTKYEVSFENRITKMLTKKEIAYKDPCGVRVPFGSRIIGVYTPDDEACNPSMYAGFIGEPLKSPNSYRYLVFFDDGISQYVSHQNVRVVCGQNKYVYDDVSPVVREFTKVYIEQFPERPMLKLQRGDVTKVEHNGEKLTAEVMTVDASMVKLHFLNTKVSEWFYRGSRRLLALNNELNNAAIIRKTRPTGRSRRHISRKKGDQPYVEYTTFISNPIVIDSGSDEDAHEETEANLAESETNVARRNVARKSTAKPHKPNLNISKKRILNHAEGLVEKIPEIAYTPVIYSPHVCSSSCLQINDVSQFKGKNPLSIPMLMGFERHIVRIRRRSSPSVIIWYRGPCGRMMRNLSEVSGYLFKTESQLTIDLFCDDPSVLIFRYFRTTVEETLWSTSDISEGVETIPIPCVNCLTNEKPPYVEYATKPFPAKGVQLNHDKEFLCGCDCTDNCQDRLKCQCQRLCFSAASIDGFRTDVGYHHRRLLDAVITGVYECNSRCSCNANCVNRVVQNPLSVRLQLFKTCMKGWGLRCIDDIPIGTFLCIYAGQVLTDAVADAEGKIIGDEYMAELDHIEIVERMKEGYEENVIVPIDIDEENGSNDCADSDADFTSSKISTSSESLPETCHESDSDFEEPTIKSNVGANNYSTRHSKQISQKKTSFLDDINDSENKEPLEPSKVELPDLNQPSGSDFKLIIRALSPETNERVITFNVGRAPNFGSKHTGAKRLVAPTNTPTLQLTTGEPPSKKYRTIRSFFGEEDCYIMDAKTKGNIGRYLNHSCDPNCFVQCVFTETHDLRFPSVAFFAKQNLKAGTELTWDYNYEVGAVLDKSLICHCGSQRCRGRLL